MGLFLGLLLATSFKGGQHPCKSKSNDLSYSAFAKQPPGKGRGGEGEWKQLFDALLLLLKSRRMTDGECAEGKR